jgi:hypothetical protein
MQLAQIAGHPSLNFFDEGLFFAENHLRQNPPGGFFTFFTLLVLPIGSNRLRIPLGSPTLDGESEGHENP